MTTETTVEHTDKTVEKFKPPSKYKVIVFNDDFTSMDFVIAMLMMVFKHSEDAATELTIKIHNQGSAVAGIYSFEIAEQKTVEATNLARINGWPLIIKCEPE